MNISPKTQSRSSFFLFLQFTLILAPFTLFFDAALLFRGRMNLSVPAAAIICFVLNAGLLVLTVYSCLKFFALQKEKRISELKGGLSRRKKAFTYLPVTLVALVFSILAFFQFDNVPLYDGARNYDALITATDNFIFTPQSFVSAFSIWTHPTQGTSLLTGAGEMLFPRQAIGVYLMTLLVSVVAIFSLYGIMGRIFPTKEAWQKAAGAAIFAFCPYVLGLFSHLNPDYFTLLFFVIFIYAFAEKLDYLAAFLALLLVFSKETGILFLFSFLVPALLIRAVKADGTNYIAKLKNYLFPKKLLLYSVAPLLFMYYALFANGLTFGEAYTNKSSFRWDNNGVHCFGINIDYISSKLDQILYVNFFWIETLLFVISVCVYLYRSKRTPHMSVADEFADVSLLAGIIISSAAYSIFSCLYITVMCPRYNVCFALPMSIACVWCVSYIWKHHAVIKTIMGFIVLLLLVQNYYSIDPALFWGHEKINLGYEYIYSPTKYIGEPSVNELYVYNRTYAYSDDLLTQALQIIRPDEEDNFVSTDSDWAELYLTGEPLVAEHLICWDPINLRRTYDTKSAGVFLPQSCSFSSADILSNKQIALPDDFYFLVTAHEYDESYSKTIVDRGFILSDSFTVSNYLGYLTVYHCSR